MSLLQAENIESFTWAFKKFQEIVSFQEKLFPTIIITDEDLSMITAIEKIFPETRHQLCSWHKSENFKKHFISLNKIKKVSSNNQQEEKEEFVVVVVDRHCVSK